MHGTFLTSRSRFRPAKECAVHNVPLIQDSIVGALVYKVGDPTPLVAPAVAERCPVCYSTVEAMMKMCIASFVRQLASVDRKAIFKVEKIVVVWKDGHQDEYSITE